MPAYNISTVGGRDRKITGADQLPARLQPVGVPVLQNKVEQGRAGHLTLSSSLYICSHDYGHTGTYIHIHTPYSETHLSPSHL